MDVYGRNPSQESGSYFRASIWSWRPIHSLISALCPDELDPELINAMAVNEGQGVEDQETCNAMAEKFEKWLENNSCSAHSVPSPFLRVTDDGRLLSAEDAAGLNVETHSPYSVSREHLTDWVQFLRHCGGFEVW